MSRSTVRRSPDFSAPTLMTMSISVAPSKIARRVSKFLTSAVVAPSGKPTTEQTPTPVPRSCAAAVATHAGLTQTVAKAELRRFAAQLLDLFAGGVRLEQGVVDHARHAGRRPRRSRAGRAAWRRHRSSSAAGPGSSPRAPHGRLHGPGRRRGPLRGDHFFGDDLDEPLKVLWVQHATLDSVRDGGS